MSADLRKRRVRLVVGAVHYRGKSYELLSAPGEVFLFSHAELDNAEKRARKAIKAKLIKKPRRRGK